MTALATAFIVVLALAFAIDSHQPAPPGPDIATYDAAIARVTAENERLEAENALLQTRIDRMHRVAEKANRERLL